MTNAVDTTAAERYAAMLDEAHGKGELWFDPPRRVWETGDDAAAEGSPSIVIERLDGSTTFGFTSYDADGEINARWEIDVRGLEVA